MFCTSVMHGEGLQVPPSVSTGAEQSVVAVRVLLLSQTSRLSALLTSSLIRATSPEWASMRTCLTISGLAGA